MSREDRAGWLFTGPVLLAVVAFFLTPVAAVFALSVTDFDVYTLGDLRNVRFVGLDTYVALFGDPRFWRAMANTAVFAVVGAPLTVGLSLAAAMLLNAATLRWRPLWRVLFFAPYVTSIAATAVVWRYLFNTRYGLINRGLETIGLPPVDWLGDPRSSIPAILIFIAWKLFGYNTVVFSAALAAVPQDLDEAARLDGASGWRRFRHVTLPAIGPVLLLAMLLSVSGFLQIFDEPYIMTQGGPAQSTLTVVYFLFTEGFEFWNLGSASAVAVVLFACSAMVMRAQTAVARRTEWL